LGVRPYVPVERPGPQGSWGREDDDVGAAAAGAACAAGQDVIQENCRVSGSRLLPAEEDGALCRHRGMEGGSGSMGIGAGVGGVEGGDNKSA